MTEERQQIDRINTEVSSQTTLLDQALALIEGKAAGGGSGGSVETCEVTFKLTPIGPEEVETTLYCSEVASDGSIAVVEKAAGTSGTTTFTAVRNSILLVHGAGSGAAVLTGAEILLSGNLGYTDALATVKITDETAELNWNYE